MKPGFISTAVLEVRRYVLMLDVNYAASLSVYFKLIKK